MKKVSLLFVCVLAFFCVACDLGADDIPRNMELDSISVEVIDRYFNLNYPFDYNKILLLGHYSDGSTRVEDASLAMYNGFDSSKKNQDLVVTAKYKGKEADFHIEIGEVRQESIEIVNYPKKLVYPQGTNLENNLDLEGIEVHARLENGKTQQLDSSMYTYSVFPLGQQNLVSIHSKEGLTCYFFVYTVGDGVVQKVESSTVPERKYNIGNTINFSGTSIKVYYDDGSFITINDGQWYTEKRIVKEEDIETVIEEEEILNPGRTLFQRFWDWFTGNNIKIQKVTNLFYVYPIKCTVNNCFCEVDFPITYKELNKIQFINKEIPDLYEGNSIDFSKTSICEFKRVYGEPESNKTETNTIQSEEYGYLKYTVDDNITFDNANTMDTPFKFNEFGLQTVYFYYKPEDATEPFKCSYDFWVHDAKFEDIYVTLNTKNYLSGKNYFAKGMDVKDCIIIKRKMSNGIINSPTIPAERCEIKPNKKVDETDDVITYKYTVTYISDNGEEKSQSIDIPFEKQND